MNTQIAANNSVVSVCLLFWLAAAICSCNSSKIPIMHSTTYEDHIGRLKYFDAPDGKLAYVDEGNGPVVLLVHGVPTSSWLYRKIIPQLTNNGLRVIAPDLLGYGQSDKPEGYDIYDEVEQGARLLLLMKHIGVQRWTHVCHDAGGLWTWEMLHRDKKGVEKLVLLNTIIYESGFHPPIRFEPGLKAKMYSKLYENALTGPLMAKATLKKWNFQKPNIDKVRLSWI